MGIRVTRKTGIPQSKTENRQLNRILESITERLEVLDGVRGDALDRAVTLRDLSNSGFAVSTVNTGNNSGTTQIVTPPDTGDGPGVGPASSPTNLAVAETFLALLITWDNPSFNLQHIEVWRGTVDNLSTATMIGTTVSPQFLDYVGASASYYYWVRAVGTDGTYSAYNAVAGTLGTTGIDPGNLTIDPRFFTLEDGTGTELPFLTDGLGNIGIDGDLIVDGSIRAQSLIADSIGAEYLAVTQLDAIAADLGTITAGLIQTDPGQGFAYRVELEATAGTAYPIWYGSGAKSAPNGRFYVDQNGNVIVKGLLEAGMISQSYFTPAGLNDPFRIACEYPASYSGGVYTGRAAHLSPTLTTGYTAPYVGGGGGVVPGVGISPYNNNTRYLNDKVCGYHTNQLILYSPTYTGHTVEYGRLGTLSETLVLRYFAEMSSTNYNVTFWLIVKYQYDTETEQFAFVNYSKAIDGSTVSIGGEDIFITRTDPWDTLRIRVGLGCDFYSLNELYRTQSVNFTVSTANFGYSDLTGITTAAPGSASNPASTPVRNPGGRYIYP